MKYILSIVLIFFVGSIWAQKIVLPVEVLGEQGKIVTRSVNLTQDQVDQVQYLWMQVNNLSYEDKASIKVNDGQWVDLNHGSVNMQYQEEARGGMAHGGFSTIRFSVPVTGFQVGNNTISFRFNHSDGISIGYRVVSFDLLDFAETRLMDPSVFEEEDPFEWTAPVGYEDAASIAAGKELWSSAPLWSNYLEPDEIGSWYGYELNTSEPIKAACADCHVTNGFDLEYFSYSNESIVERSIFHKLTEDEGNKIAAYIRSLSSEPSGPQRHGRPWNPPYQPGPELEDYPIEKWAAGAGLDAILDEDVDMLEYMFPNGVDSLAVADYFDNDKVEDHTLMPVAIHMPDWKHWLPLIHPMDAYSVDNFYETTRNRSRHPEVGWERMKNYLDAMPIENRNMEQFKNELKIMHTSFRHYHDQFSVGDKRHWRALGDHVAQDKYHEVIAHIPDGVPVEMTVTSLARLLAVRNFEIMNLYDLQDKNEWFVIPEDYDELTPRRWQWLGSDYNIFEVPPHFTSCATNSNCDNFIGQSKATGNYESTAWYQLQLVLNGGNGNVGGNDPMDWQYQLSFILRASASSGIYEPIRLYHSLNAMYQLRSYKKHPTPNKNGFRARQQMPHWFFGVGDGNSFYGFAPGEFAGLLDDIQPGMKKLFLDALLRQFLNEVQRPEMNLRDWDRLAPNGGSYELEPSNHSEALVNIESKIGLYYYVDKMFYLIPKFAEVGVDCQIIDELIDWSAEAWPNYDWDQFRTSTKAVVQLEDKSQAECEGTTLTLQATAGNHGGDSDYVWRINGMKQSGNADSFSTDDILPGDVVSVEIESTLGCTLGQVAKADYVVPVQYFNTYTNKNNEGWVEYENLVVCADDQVAVRVDIQSKPRLWLDALQIKENGAPQNGELISEWYDRSGNDYDVSTTNQALYPSYSETGMNGLPAVMFGMNNNADGLQLFNTGNDDFMEDDWSVVVVGQELVRTGNWADIIGNKTETKFDDGWFIRFSDYGANQVSAGGAFYQDNSTQLPIQFIAVLSKKGRDISFTLNGHLTTAFTMEEGENITNPYGTYLGLSERGSPNTGRYHRGPISEVMIFDYALVDKEQEYLEGYLGHKWKVNNNLTSNHQFRENSPLDIRVELPDGNQLQLDGVNREFEYHITDSNTGIVNFYQNASSCINPQRTHSLLSEEGLASADDLIEYSINNRAYVAGSSVEVKSGSDLNFKPNYAVGDYQWEKPDGTLLAINAEPMLKGVKNDDNIGIWTLHADLGGCIADVNETVPFEVIYASPENYSITVNLSGNGISNVDGGSASVAELSDFTILLTPDAGHNVEILLVNGASQNIGKNFGDPIEFDLNEIVEDYHIEVTFAPIVYHEFDLITSQGGITSPAEGKHDVADGDSFEVFITPDDGYLIKDVRLNDQSIEIKSNYTFSDITSPQKLEVSFEIIYYSIQASSSENGSIDPEGSSDYAAGTSPVFKVIPDQGYEIEDVWVNDVSIGAVEEVTFPNISKPGSVHATFRPQTFAITASTGNNGEVTPAGTEKYQAGTHAVYLIKPDAGYQVQDVLIDGESIGAQKSYVFESIVTDHTIHANFEEIPSVAYTVSASSGDNGKISPEGNQQVDEGGQVTFSIQADDDFEIEDVLVNGVSVGAVDTYTFDNVSKDQTIHASFIEIPVLAIDDLSDKPQLYPNPSSGEFYLRIGQKVDQVVLTSLEGRRISVTKSIGQNHFKISDYDLKEGIYLVNVHLQDRTNKTFKLMVVF